MLHRPPDGQLFKHQDGGYYRYLGMVRHADDQAPHVRYEHLWPFETEGDPWVRRATEWESRFTAVTEAQLQAAMQEDRATAQDAVALAKATRRAKGKTLAG